MTEDNCEQENFPQIYVYPCAQAVLISQATDISDVGSYRECGKSLHELDLRSKDPALVEPNAGNTDNEASTSLSSTRQATLLRQAEWQRSWKRRLANFKRPVVQAVHELPGDLYQERDLGNDFDKGTRGKFKEAIEEPELNFWYLVCDNHACFLDNDGPLELKSNNKRVQTRMRLWWTELLHLFNHEQRSNCKITEQPVYLEDLLKQLKFFYMAYLRYEPWIEERDKLLCLVFHYSNKIETRTPNRRIQEEGLITLQQHPVGDAIAATTELLEKVHALVLTLFKESVVDRISPSLTKAQRAHLPSDILATLCLRFIAQIPVHQLPIQRDIYIRFEKNLKQAYEEYDRAVQDDEIGKLFKLHLDISAVPLQYKNLLRVPSSWMRVSLDFPSHSPMEQEGDEPSMPVLKFPDIPRLSHYVNMVFARAKVARSVEETLRPSQVVAKEPNASIDREGDVACISAGSSPATELLPWEYDGGSRGYEGTIYDWCGPL